MQRSTGGVDVMSECGWEAGRMLLMVLVTTTRKYLLPNYSLCYVLLFYTLRAIYDNLTSASTHNKTGDIYNTSSIKNSRITVMYLHSYARREELSSLFRETVVLQV